MMLTVGTPLGAVSVHITGQDPGAAPTVLMLHANPGDSRDFDAVTPVLGSEYAIASVDWPGYGQSTVADARQVTALGLAEVGELVLDHLAEHGIKRVAIIGNSVGGFAAVRLAVCRPESVTGVVLVDSAGYSPQNALTRTFCRQVMGRPWIASRLVTPLARAYLGRLRTSSARATYERAKQVRNDPVRLEVHCAIWRSFADPRFDLSDTAPAVPTLVVWGKRDPVLLAVIDGRRTRRCLPDAEFVLLPTGHEPFNERPELFLRKVTSFLAQHARSQR
ncbi:alpha/beta hydrolase [Nocardia sp. NPDC049220]|uniref:alpha/beta fold hydrolase n=1 Tax=Nocardia sp. NPDC049220 TaxID=3155273 RepID=UPI0033FB163D